ncbi:hypothetical protein HF086_016892 [Spodoptera exigua]|uniref:RED-like N-terminal domain-containing protein n=1 Tax=Spodoptera exigua TaxID=7107 RepID=A0A922M9V7_SPOEX|nr:hypothetical protein HF086_016892 [Spodoptera exigua]
MDDNNVEQTPASQRLTNEDFRKLLMTPRATPGGSGGSHPAGSVREAMANSGSMPPPAENKGELRRKKKSYYAALKKQEDNKLAELAEKYRDRARERRDGVNELGPMDPTSNTSSAYSVKWFFFQESKYLGGDMEHTHLVKGLDYALLQKVRSEIQTREQEQEAEMERLVTTPVEPVKEKKEVPVDKPSEKGRADDSIYGEIGEYNPGERQERRDDRARTGAGGIGSGPRSSARGVAPVGGAPVAAGGGAPGLRRVLPRPQRDGRRHR